MSSRNSSHSAWSRGGGEKRPAATWTRVKKRWQVLQRAQARSALSPHSQGPCLLGESGVCKVAVRHIADQTPLSHERVLCGKGRFPAMGDAGKPRVLIVDDESPYRQAVADILQRSRLEVRYAGDALEGMEVLRSWRPDVLLLDVMMPNVSGLTLLKRLRADPRWKDLPVVMVSALARKDDMEAGKAAGANEYLTKPFTTADLRRVLRRFIQVLGTAELEAGGDS